MTTLYRVLVVDPENNEADVIVSAGSYEQATAIAIKAADEVLGESKWNSDIKWQVSPQKDAVTPIELHPPRYHAITPGWS